MDENFFILSVIFRLLNSLLLPGYTHDTLAFTFDLLERDGGSGPSPEDPALWFKEPGAACGSCSPVGSSGSRLAVVEAAAAAASGLYRT